MGSAAI
jgi:hypothetical protein